MITLVVYHRITRKVIQCINLELLSDEDSGIDFDVQFIEYDNFTTELFADAEPVFISGEDGNVYLKPNSFVIYTEDLEEEEDDYC